MAREHAIFAGVFIAVALVGCEEASSPSATNPLPPPRFLINGGESCAVPFPSTVCNSIAVNIVPFVHNPQDSIAWPAWQSDTGNGNPTTKPDTITFSQAVNSVTVTALDPDYAGDSMKAYDANNNLLASVAFEVDNTPTVYTTSQKSVAATGIRKVILKPASTDYIAYDNLRATTASGASCAIGRPTSVHNETYCGGITVAISPYVFDSNFPVWQSAAGHGNPTTAHDTVTFSQSVSSVTVTALDPDYADSMIAYNSSGTRIAAVAFDGDNTPGVFTTSTKSIAATGIRKIILKPASNDYIAYDNLSFSP